MKKMNRVLFVLIMLLFPIFDVYAAGSLTVSPTSLTIDVGKSKTFTIKASSAAGRVDISTSDSSVATVSSSSKFLDNSSVKITVKGKKEGIATIKIKLTDVANYDGKVLTGTKTVKITVKKASEKNTTTPSTPKVMNITKFEVVGYDLKFNKNISDYRIDVDSDVKSLYVLIEGSNFSVTGNKVVNIEGKDKIKVVLKDDTQTKEYTINLNKTKKEVESTKETIETTKIVEKEVQNNIYMYSTIALGVLSFILLILYITKKPKVKEKYTQNMVRPQVMNNNVSYQPNTNFNINPTQYTNQNNNTMN